ncbi:hypothetical protein [Candidatus Amarolinea dominans]|uniref:hypothetical protein n=1 Tax=Candidatus Amarolinea dominans TaxID=3140696 RepID=UPI0031CC7336
MIPIDADVEGRPQSASGLGALPGHHSSPSGQSGLAGAGDRRHLHRRRIYRMLPAALLEDMTFNRAFTDKGHL